MKIKNLLAIIAILVVGLGMPAGFFYWNSQPRVGKIVHFKDIENANGVNKPVIGTAVFSADGKSVLTGNYAGKFSIRDTETGNVVVTLDGIGPTTALNKLQWSSDGTRVLGMAEFDGAFSIVVWDAKTGKQVFRPNTGHARGATFSADGKEVLAWGEVQPESGPWTSFMYIFDSQGGRRIKEFKISGLQKTIGEPFLIIEAAAMSPDGKQIVFSRKLNRVSNVWVFDRETENPVGILPVDSGRGMLDSVRDLKFSTSGNSILAIGDDGKISLFRLYKDPRIQMKFDGVSAFVAGQDQPQRVMVAGFRKFQTSERWGRRLSAWTTGFNPIMTDDNSKVQIFNIDEGQFNLADAVGRDELGNDAIAARISSDGNSLAVVMSKGQIVHWNMNTKRWKLKTNFDNNDVRH